MAYSIDRALRYLGEARRQGRLGHAYLVSGGTRADREELVLRLIGLVSERVFASLDEVAAAEIPVVRPEMKSRRISVVAVRALEHGLHMGGGGKLAVIEEADRLNDQAANAFLKTLEEPPPETLLLLSTSEPEQLLETIRSRCIRIPLRTAGGFAGEFGETEHALVGLLAEHFRSGRRDIGAALHFKLRFAELMKSVRDEIAKSCEADFKAEAERYKKRIEGDWLEKREVYFKALAESRALRRREVMFGVISAWFGDALRHKLGLAPVDLPDYGEHTEVCAQALSVDDLLAGIDAVDDLAGAFRFQVQENLAFDAGFIGMFASS